MKIALIADIHGNLPSLEVVLADAEKQGAEIIWNLGDFLGYGPFPNEVVALLRTSKAKNIIGNYDLKVLDFDPQKPHWKKKSFSPKYFSFEWTSKELTQF